MLEAILDGNVGCVMNVLVDGTCQLDIGIEWKY